MYLHKDEKLIKRIHHHYWFYLIKSVIVWLYSLPFFLLAWLITFQMPQDIQVVVYLFVTIIFALAWFYDAMIFHLDCLIVTNQRIIHLDWKSPFHREEVQLSLDDIQNIFTIENGVLSKFHLFDFGTFRAETSSTKMTINFEKAPDPEGIKFFINGLLKKERKGHSHQSSEINKTTPQLQKVAN